MASSSPLRYILILLVVLPALRALEVSPGSSCASLCLDEGETDAFDSNASSTNTSDLICRDVDFSTEDKGIKFKNCVECLAKSKKVNEEESDLHWYLFNLRYTLTGCLFGIPGSSFESNINSPCIIDHACRPLEDPLTDDGLEADRSETYGYCDANEGAFMANKTWTCVSCLQASNDQSYLSNFMVALQAGCKQRPKPGELVSVSGSVFTTNSINITEPEENILERPSGAGTNTLTTGAIVGIAVGVGLFFLGAIALFIIHYRKKKQAERDEKADYHGSLGGTPDPILPPDSNHMTASLRSHSQQSQRGNGGNMSSGDYYDKLEGEIHSGRGANYAYDPRSKSRGPNSALPAHQAYIPQAISRLRDEGSQPGTNSRTPSPPAATHRHTKSNPAGSFAMQAYLSSLEEPVPSARSQSASRRTASVDRGIGISIPPPPPLPTKGAKGHSMGTPSLALPAVPKLRMPKKYTPPNVTVTDMDRRDGEMQISDPVMTKEARFTDEPLRGGPVLAHEGHVHVTEAPAHYGDIPMRSGKSTLYGM